MGRRVHSLPRRIPPITDGVEGNASAGPWPTGTRLSILAKRIPVKAADTAVAMNYAALMIKCREYPVETGQKAHDAAEEANALVQEEHTVKRIKAQ